MAISSDGRPPRRARGRFRGAVGAALPAERFGDHLTLLSGTGQNVAGLAIYVLASFGANVLISRAFAPAGGTALGLVTLATQLAFVAGAGTRFGMDMAAVRLVAIDVGKGRTGGVRAVVGRAAVVAAVVSAAGAIIVFALAGPLGRLLGAGHPAAAAGGFRAAALALPFVAVCQVYLGGTRGLKIMRHTLFVFWAGQPVAWIALMLTGWAIRRTVAVTVLAYALSWVLATVAAALLWRRETRAFPPGRPEPGETRELVRYGAPRAPAALLSQLLFWTDYFVLGHYVTTGQHLGVYAAAVRVAQALVLFLTAVSYMFSPFVADLHARGERDRLDGLYKALTRWTVAGTVPILLLLAIVPGPVLRMFGGSFGSGATPLRILLIGQMVNVSVGAVGFILIMVGRTGWDLVIYAGSFLIDLVVAVALVPHLGAEGAAIAQTTTLVVSNAARLYLVWRFVRIQPFDRHYARLAIPALAGAVVMLGVHLALRHAAWPADLVASGAAGTIAYAIALVAAGLTPTERATVTRLMRQGRTASAGPRGGDVSPGARDPGPGGQPPRESPPG